MSLDNLDGPLYGLDPELVLFPGMVVGLHKLHLSYEAEGPGTTSWVGTNVIRRLDGLLLLSALHLNLWLGTGCSTHVLALMPVVD